MENIQPELHEEVSVATCADKFYVVSPKKFSVLFLSTMGFYGVYWVYINWSIYKKSSGSDVWPIARGFFDIFFVHSLCEKVGKLGSATSKENAVMEWNAIKYVLLAFSGRIAEKLSDRDIGSPYTFLYSLLVIPLMYRALYNIQMYVNKLMKDEAGEANAAFTWANYIWILLGILLWGLTFLVGYDAVLGEI